LVSQSVNKLVS